MRFSLGQVRLLDFREGGDGVCNFLRATAFLHGEPEVSGIRFDRMWQFVDGVGIAFVLRIGPGETAVAKHTVLTAPIGDGRGVQVGGTERNSFRSYGANESVFVDPQR